MKLYFSPGTCSLSPHIALREAAIPFELVRVSFRTKTTEFGEDFLAINPKGYVPALLLDDGELLTEGPAIVQYIADQRPEARLAPPNGSIERTRLQEWLNYIGTELHKAFGPLFGSKDEALKTAAREKLALRLRYVEKRLEAHAYLVGDGFTVADGYLFVILRWAHATGVEVTPNLLAFEARVRARPAVVAALEAELRKKPA